MTYPTNYLRFTVSQRALTYGRSQWPPVLQFPVACEPNSGSSGRRNCRTEFPEYADCAHRWATNHRGRKQPQTQHSAISRPLRKLADIVRLKKAHSTAALRAAGSKGTPDGRHPTG